MFNKSVCIYLQVHQPWRLTKLNILDINSNINLFEGFNDTKNEIVFNKIAHKCYLPTNKLLLKLLKKYPEFKLSLSLSGTFIEQSLQFNPKVLNSFKKLVDTGKVELLNETYYHSLAFLYSKAEFAEQIKLHRSMIWSIFKRRPTVFRNTELIFNSEIANFVRLLGFDAILAEGWLPAIDNNNPNFIYYSSKESTPSEDESIANKYSFTKRRNNKIKVLLKNHKLSDDIAFKFSDKNWSEFPLTASKFASWINKSPGNSFNLFMDFETFGEHQWEDSGVFHFLEDLPIQLEKYKINFKTASETLKSYRPQGEINVKEYISWADESRDLSAWVGNTIQNSAISSIYEIESKVKEVTKGSNNRKEKDQLVDMWRKLQTSDHFYYMCTKYWNDGSVHKYFSPYESPYNAYINYMNCYNDFIIRLENLENKK